MWNNVYKVLKLFGGIWQAFKKIEPIIMTNISLYKVMVRMTHIENARRESSKLTGDELYLEIKKREGGNLEWISKNSVSFNIRWMPARDYVKSLSF